MKTEDLVEYLNKKKIRQEFTDPMECLSDDDWEKYFDGESSEVATDLDVSKHRWFETSITVYKMKDGSFIGVEHVSDTFGDMQTVRDCYVDLRWFEMKEVATVTYEEK